MIILGIDPGLASVGWAIIEKSGQIKLIDSGCFNTKKGVDFSQRLVDIAKHLEKLIDQYHPQALAIEELFFAKNVKTAIKVAQCLGVIKFVVNNKGVEVNEYSPLNIKLTMTGYGQADKKQVEQMVVRSLKLNQKIYSNHAIDAIAAGLTYCYTNKILNK